MVVTLQELAMKMQTPGESIKIIFCGDPFAKELSEELFQVQDIFVDYFHWIAGYNPHKK